MMSPEDQELVEFLDSVSFADDAPDWRDKPELGEDPDDDDEDGDDLDDEDEDEDEDGDIIE